MVVRPTMESLQNAASSLICHALPWDGNLAGEAYARWHELFQRLPALPVFFAPEWTAFACQAGITRPWRVLVVEQHGHPVAVLPLQKRTPWTASITQDILQYLPPLLIAPEAESLVWAALTRWLKTEAGVFLLELGRHTAGDRLERFTRIAAAHGAAPRSCTVSQRIFIQLPECWEAYLALLGAKTRADIRRLERQFTQDIPGASFEMVTTQPAFDQSLQELIALHRQRWRQQREGSDFDDPRRKQFYETVCRWAVAQHATAIAAMRINDTLIAALTCFFSPGQDTLYCHYFARDRDVDLPKRFSPGILLFAKTFQWAIARGMRRVDMAYSSNEYKVQLGGETHDQWEVFLGATPLLAQVGRKLNGIDYGCRQISAHMRRLARSRRE